MSSRKRKAGNDGFNGSLDPMTKVADKEAEKRELHLGILAR